MENNLKLKKEIDNINFRQEDDKKKSGIRIYDLEEKLKESRYVTAVLSKEKQVFKQLKEEQQTLEAENAALQQSNSSLKKQVEVLNEKDSQEEKSVNKIKEA